MVSLEPEPQRPAALHALNSEKLLAEIDDGKWEQWYSHYHRIVLSEPDRDFQWYVAHGLAYNLETAAVYVLLSALFVANVRRWWCLVPASLWILILIAQEYNVARKYFDPWSTLSEQIDYLDRRNRQVAS